MKFGSKISKKICIMGIVVCTSILLCGFDLNPRGIPSTFVVNNSSIIIVGDSRVVLMHDVVGDAGCDWMATAGTKFEELMEYAKIIDTMNLNGKKVVISYGINDINTVNPSLNSFFKYQNFMSTKAQEWVQKGATVYFTEIPGVTKEMNKLPGCEGCPVEKINEFVRQFNGLTTSGGFPSNIRHINLNMDSHLYLDGLHYNEMGDIYAFNCILNQVK